MTTYKDTDLREALRRKYANTPKLPADFMNRMQQASQPKQHCASSVIRHSSLFTRCFAAVFSIAAAILIAFLLWPGSHKDTMTQQEVQPAIAEAEPQPVALPIVKEKKEEVLAEVQPMPQPVKKQRKADWSENISAEAVLVQEEHEARVCGMNVRNDVVDSKMQLYTAEIELEKNTHQRQEAYEKEMQRRGLELLLYLMSDKEENMADGTVNTQKS